MARKYTRDAQGVLRNEQGMRVIDGRKDANWMKIAAAGFSGDEELPPLQQMQLENGDPLDPKEAPQKA